MTATETPVQTQTRPATSPEGKTRLPPQWNVVLLNDEEHTYEYVIRMVQELFRANVTKAFKVAQTVDSQGRAILLTTHKEHAELKRDQVHAYGRDHLIMACKGSMTAIIEPAEFGGDDSEGCGDDPGHGEPRR